MTDQISREITGAPVKVRIAGRECVVSFPMHNLLLFKELTGLSLFNGETWNRLEFGGALKNLQIWQSALFAGLHERQADRTWSAPFTLEQIEDETVVGLHNAIDVHNALFRALTRWMPRKKDDDAEASAEKKSREPIATISAPSGSEQIVDSDSLVPTSL